MNSKRLIGRVKDRFKELKHKRWDWRSFYNGWIEGRVDLLSGLREDNSNSPVKQTIVWGQSFMDAKTGEDANVHVTNIHINNMSGNVTAIVETGIDVKAITLTMERAMKIGFINLNALSDYC